MLDVQKIYKTFNPGTVNEKRALNGLSLQLAEGDFVTVIGGNGAGKSTLLNALAGTWLVEIFRKSISRSHDGNGCHDGDSRKFSTCC